MTTDDQRVGPQVVIEAEHHRIARFHHQILNKLMKKKGRGKLSTEHNVN